MNHVFDELVESVRRDPEPHPSQISSTSRRAKYREQAIAQLVVMDEVAQCEDVRLSLDEFDVPARLYVPTLDRGDSLIVYAHGGSFTVGDLDTHEGLCRRIANDTACRVLALDYRLAPEHPFPQGLSDVTGAIAYVDSHRKDFGASDASLIVMGDSAGANLITVATSQLRDRVAISAQVLVYPTLGPNNVTASSHRYGSGYLLEMDHLRFDYEQYIAGQVDPTSPLVSPLLHTNLTGVAPAVIVVAECDPLRDEGVAYAGLLEHFGVPARLFEARGMLHGFLRYGQMWPEVQTVVDDVGAHIRQHLTEFLTRSP